MRDFLKILVGLLLLAGAFNFGRHFEASQIDEAALSAQLLEAQKKLEVSESRFMKLKEQFQEAFDGPDAPSASRVFGQLMTILITQMDVKLSEEQSKQIYAQIKEQLNSDKIRPLENPERPENPPSAPSIVKNQPPKLKRAQDSDGKILNMQSFLTNAEPVSLDQMADLTGQYKGRIVDLKNQTYAAVSFKLNSVAENQNVIAEMQISRDGQVRTKKMQDSFGLTHKDKSDWLIEHEPGRYIYFSNVSSGQKLIGDYYEVMPQGTTKLIGKVDLTKIEL